MNVVLFLLASVTSLILNQASATAVATATTVPAAHSGTIFVASDRNLQKRSQLLLSKFQSNCRYHPGGTAIAISSSGSCFIRLQKAEDRKDRGA